MKKQLITLVFLITSLPAICQIDTANHQICIPRTILEQVVRDLKLGDICAQENAELLEQHQLMQGFVGAQDSMISVLRLRLASSDSIFDATLEGLDLIKATESRANKTIQRQRNWIRVLAGAAIAGLAYGIF